MNRIEGAEIETDFHFNIFFAELDAYCCISLFLEFLISGFRTDVALLRLFVWNTNFNINNSIYFNKNNSIITNEINGDVALLRLYGETMNCFTNS